MTELSQRQRRGRMLALMAVLVVELAVIATLVMRYEWRLWYGRPVVLQTVPVDPRDLFRGDYVILNYDVALPDGMEADEADDGTCRRGDLWLILNQSEDKVSQVRRVERAAPATLADDEAVLKVRAGCWRGTDFPDTITRYYVPEGTGRDMEKLVREKRLSVVLATTPDGEASIAALRLDDEMVSDERLF